MQIEQVIEIAKKLHKGQVVAYSPVYKGEFYNIQWVDKDHNSFGTCANSFIECLRLAGQELKKEESK